MTRDIAATVATFQVSAETELRDATAIMFSDMVGYTALTRSDEPLALDLQREHLDMLRDILLMFRGREVRVANAGVVVEFPSALAAAQCAIEFQRSLSERNEKRPEEKRILTRIGIHVAPADRGGTDVAGEAVDVAMQAERLAEPGGICVTGAVFDQIENQVGHPLVPVVLPRTSEFRGQLTAYNLDFHIPASPAAVQAARRKLFWMVMGILVLNVVLFLTFGLHRRTPSPQGTNAAPDTAQTNAPQIGPR